MYYLLFTTKARIAKYCSMLIIKSFTAWMTKGNRPRQRLFLSFQYASVWRLFLFSRNIKPQKMRIWIAYFTALVPFGLPCGLHNPKVIAQGWKARWSIFLVSCLFQAFRWEENGASREQREKNSKQNRKRNHWINCTTTSVFLLSG